MVSVSKSKETSPIIVKPVESEDENKESFIQKVEASEVDTPYEETNLPSDMDVLLKLYDHICEKINKLTSEIEYIDNIIESRYSYSLTYDELKQFKRERSYWKGTWTRSTSRSMNWKIKSRSSLDS